MEKRLFSFKNRAKKPLLACCRGCQDTEVHIRIRVLNKIKIQDYYVVVWVFWQEGSKKKKKSDWGGLHKQIYV